MPLRECKFEEAPDNIVELRELTKALEFTGILHRGDAQQTLAVDVAKGTSFMTGLYNTEQITVSKVYGSAGCKYHRHIHNQWELCVVYKGKLEIIMGDVRRTLHPKNFFYIEPNVEHTGIFHEETELIAIIIPGDTKW
ncbi:unnamed protein product, partial [marine sediment metagenome]